MESFFLESVGFVPRKAAKLENPLWPIDAKLESVETKSLEPTFLLKVVCVK